MFNALRITAAAAVLLGLAGAATAATQDFTLRNNNRSVSIVSLHFAHTGARDEAWSANVLSSRVAPRSSRAITFDGYSRNDCMWDVKVVYSDGGSVTTTENLCKTDTLSFI